MIKKFYNIQWQDDSDPCVDPIGRKLYRLEETFSINFYASTSRDGVLKTYRMEVKKGFLTDLQSAPRLTWSIFGYRPDGLVRQAGVLHDAGYSSGGLKDCKYASMLCTTDNEPVALSRLACDQIYKASYIHSAEQAEIPSKKDIRLAKLGYIGLRIGGWVGFGKDKYNKCFK